MKEAALPIGHDFSIEDRHGHAAFQIDGSLFRVRETLTVRDPAGSEVCTIRGSFLDTKQFTISRAESHVATVRQLHESSVPPGYAVELATGAHLDIAGSPAEREYSLLFHGATIATVSKARLSLQSSYDVDITSGQDDVTVLAVVVSLDVISRP